MAGQGLAAVVNVGAGGTFRATGELHTTPADVDAFFERLDGSRGLAVHFHGGLISEQRGRRIADELLAVYGEVGSVPVFFLWETGIAETVRSNLRALHETSLFDKIVRLVIKQVAGRDTHDGTARGGHAALLEPEIDQQMVRDDPFASYDETGSRALDEDTLDEILEDIRVDLEIAADEDDELTQLLADPQERTDLFDDELAAEVERDPGKAAGLLVIVPALLSVTYEVLKRRIRGRDHGLYTTVVEEVLRRFYVAKAGRWVWDGIKLKAEGMWQPNSGLGRDDLHAGTYFLSRLVELRAAHPELAVDLIGHSAGSIAVCRMLRGMADAGLRARNVIFLAPACRTDLFDQELVSRPERFESFRMFTMSDDYERRDRLLPVVYPRSLLYFVSGVLEAERDATLVGLARHVQGGAPYDGGELPRITEFLRGGPGVGEPRTVLAVTPPGAAPGLRTEATSHAAFDEDRATRSSLRHIVGTAHGG